MSGILDAISFHADNNPGNVALHSGNRKISYAVLQKNIWNIARKFVENDIRVMALHLDNGIEWVIADLAARFASVTIVPLPAFFSQQQIAHIFEKANIDTVVSMDRKIIPYKCEVVAVSELMPGINLYKCERISGRHNFLKNTGKITFTSGTTGTPKGICLTNDSLSGVAKSLHMATADVGIEKHLCLLPLTALLENVAGIYALMLKGATCQVPSQAETGLSGAARFNVARMIDCVVRYRPDSIILLPQMLHDIVCAIETGLTFPDSLKFIAVGGGVVSLSVVRRARALNLPVYEGYGISECGSVVALNTPEHDRPGSAGKILDNINIALADDNEIMLKGNFMQGYLGGQPISQSEWLATGDIGKIDGDGFLHVTGRKKNIFITSFGRNISPEWTECELIDNAAILQAVVFGEARPVNCAVIVPQNEWIEDHFIENAINQANKKLPDYAQIHYWVRAKEEFSLSNGLATANGKPVRDRIYRLYETAIKQCYKKLLISGSA